MPKLSWTTRSPPASDRIVRVGAPLASPDEPPARLTRRLERRLQDELDRLDADLTAAHPAGYRVVLAGRGSLSAFYDRTAGRLRGRPPE